MARPNVVVFGYDELLSGSLEFLARARNRIAAVVFPSTRTDWRAEKIRAEVRGKGFLTLEQPPQNEAAAAAEFTRKLRRIKPDLIYVWSYPMILPAEIVKIPKYGCVNVHMGLLPEYRGVNGVRWALINGEEKTGVTIHYMDAGVDTGDIIARVSFPIEPADDILSLMKKSRSAGLHLLANCWQEIAAGRARGVPQDASLARTYTAKMSAFGALDWSRPNVEIHNLIRASAAPFPGVYTFWNDLKLVIRKSVLIDSRESRETFGEVAKIDERGAEITTGGGNLLVTRIECGDKIHAGAEIAALGLRAGSRFSNA